MSEQMPEHNEIDWFWCPTKTTTTCCISHQYISNILLSGFCCGNYIRRSRHKVLARAKFKPCVWIPICGAFQLGNLQTLFHQGWSWYFLVSFSNFNLSSWLCLLQICGIWSPVPWLWSHGFDWSLCPTCGQVNLLLAAYNLNIIEHQVVLWLEKGLTIFIWWFCC